MGRACRSLLAIRKDFSILQQLQPSLVMSRADVLDIPRPAMRGVDDLHRRRARRRLHGPHIRHRASLRLGISAQIRSARGEKPQVSEPPAFRVADRVKSQGWRCLQAPLVSGGQLEVLAYFESAVLLSN